MLYIKSDKVRIFLKKKAINDPYLQKIIIYGSYARREHLPDSDIDTIMISDDIKLSKNYWSQIQFEILELYAIHVSMLIVSTLDELPPHLSSTIKNEGILLWQK